MSSDAVGRGCMITGEREPKRRGKDIWTQREEREEREIEEREKESGYNNYSTKYHPQVSFSLFEIFLKFCPPSYHFVLGPSTKLRTDLILSRINGQPTWVRGPMGFVWLTFFFEIEIFDSQFVKIMRRCPMV